MLDRITPLVLTFNEEANLARTLARLQWARRVICLDSGSTDRTVAIARSTANVQLVTRAFDSHAAQWNFGLAQAGIDTEWVLALDADYLLPDEFIAELARLDPPEAVQGYRAGFRYCIEGRPLSGSLYPDVTVLFRRAGARYVQDGHTQRVQIDGLTRRLQARIDHDDRKPLSRWLASQERYAALEAGALAGARWSALRWQDRVRRLIFIAPWLAPLYALLLKGCLLDGRAGWHYALQRAIAEAILSMKLVEASLPRAGKSQGR